MRRRDDASLQDVAIDPGLVMTLVALRDARRGDILGALRRHMRALRALAAVRHMFELFDQIVAYLVRVVPELPETGFRDILREAVRGKEIMPTLAEKWLAQGEARGEARGETKGELKALRAMLRKQLELKFGELDADHDARLQAATSEELQRFVERIVSADSVEAVLTSES